MISLIMLVLRVGQKNHAVQKQAVEVHHTRPSDMFQKDFQLK